MSTKSAFSSVLANAKAHTLTNHHRSALCATLGDRPEVKAAFMLLPPALRAKAWMDVSQYSSAVTIGVRIGDLPSFKAPALMRVLSRFAGDEWTAKTNDYTYSTPNRDYQFSRSIALPDDYSTFARHPSARWLIKHGAAFRIPTHFDLSVFIYAYVVSDSPTCRVVVTGVKEEVIRTETKAIVCD